MAFRLLVVEDDYSTLGQLRSLLTEEFPGVEIHSATDQEQAIAHIRRSAAQGREYDIALLDFKLPAHPGEIPEVNQDVYRELRETMRDSVVIHTSAYIEDPSLMKMILAEAQRPPSERRSVFLSKRNAEWPTDLIRLVSTIGSRGQKESLQPSRSFRSCFISYSHQDEEFVHLLYSRLKSEGLSLWYAAEHMKPGRKLHEEIENAVRVYDKLLIVLSEASMQSEWVITEIRNAIAEERRNGVRKLFPVRLVDFDAIRAWKRFDADVGKDIAVELREYFIPDFSRWRKAVAFEQGIQALLIALRVDEGS